VTADLTYQGHTQVAQAIIEDRTTMWMHTAMPMTANYERAVTEHVVDLYEERGELLALIEMIRSAITF
jgi:hypothetical protein